MCCPSPMAAASSQTALGATSATIPEVVLIDSFTSALGEPLAVGVVSPCVSSPWGSSTLSLPLPVLAPLPTAVAAGGSLEVGRLAPEFIGLQEQTVSAMVAGGVTLPAWLAKGGKAEAEEWRRLKSASLRANMALETI